MGGSAPHPGDSSSILAATDAFLVGPLPACPALPQIQGLPTLVFVGMDPAKPALRTEGLLPAQVGGAGGARGGPEAAGWECLELGGGAGRAVEGIQ